MKISLSLSGGAARGAFHLGVLQAIDELGFVIEQIAGSSIGALIGVSYASGVSPKKQLEIFKSKEFKKVFKTSFRGGIFRIDEQNEILEQLSPYKTLEELPIKTSVTVIDLSSAEVLYLGHGEIKKLCAASCALLPLFAPCRYENQFLADGGIMDNLPVFPLLKTQNPLIAVDLHPLQKDFKHTTFGFLKRGLFLMWRSGVRKNFEHIDLYISDEKLSSYSLFSFKKLDELFALGYERGVETLSQFKAKE